MSSPPLIQRPSRGGDASPEPYDVTRGWNWGAFWLNWVWGIANNTWIALLMFVPVVNLVMPFVLGAKGNRWAWENNTWRDVEHFRRTQRLWSRVGWGAAIVLSTLCGLALWLGVTLMTSSEPYQASLAIIRDHPKLERSLGAPVVPSGWLVGGTINYDNDGGSAALSYDVAGPKGAATVHVDATRQRGTWHLDSLVAVHKDGWEIWLIGSPAGESL